MPAAAVIPAPRVYLNIVVIKTLVVEFQSDYSIIALLYNYISPFIVSEYTYFIQLIYLDLEHLL